MPIPSVLVIIADGFEEAETVTPVDLLRRAGAKVTVAGLAEGIHVTGRSGITLHADAPLSSVEAVDFDCVLLPGGPGVRHLRGDPRVAAIIARQHQSNRWIAAICAAPTILKDAGVLGKSRYTAHFSVAAELPEAQLDERIVVDGRIITSRGAGTSVDFGLAIVGQLFSAEKAEEVSKSISA
jgi:4-methyl-5(b-hydroxyethyl)-thiazole monophosphate biosynthesis